MRKEKTESNLLICYFFMNIFVYKKFVSNSRLALLFDSKSIFKWYYVFYFINIKSIILI